MRILHILDHSIPLHSGYTFRTLSILEYQRKLGWETVHLTSPKQKDCNDNEQIVDGWHFYRTPAARHAAARLPVLNQLAVMQQLSHRLDEIIPIVKPNVIHAHSPVLNALPALWAARRHGLPVVYEVRAFWEDAAVDQGTGREGGVRYRLTKALESYALRNVDAVTTICEGLRNDIQQRGIAPEKITVIPNAVDVASFSPSAQRDADLVSQLGLQGKVLLGFIGSFYAYEGLSLLLHALPRMLAQQPNIHLLLVGGGPQDAQLKQLTRELGLMQHVTFTGRVPHAQVQRYYTIIDLLVYPRLSMRLTDLVTPLKPLEAMAQGRLVCASDVGGHRELIRHGETGMLFKSGDAQALAIEALKLLAMPQQWPRMRQTARAFVEHERTWQRSVSRYQPVYQAVLESSSRRACSA